MRQSQLFTTTRREAPKDETSKNAILLMRGGYISKTMAGVYSFLPLGLRVLHKVTALVRRAMVEKLDGQEILMPALQPRELWEESGRWEEYGDDMYRLEEETMGLGPTHEEVATTLFKDYVSSYKSLPLSVFQIQTKFRRELRAKSGLLRGREFLMKDLYSFHASEADLHAFYDRAKVVYKDIFTQVGLDALLTEASGGLFSQFSHEFQVVSTAGEDTIYLSADGTVARNKEIVTDLESTELLEFSGGTIRTDSAVEVGNIFPLNLKFSKPMQALVTTETGERVPVYMGCYGIGISRLIGVVVEQFGATEPGSIMWPASIAPFSVHVIDLTPTGEGATLYADLTAAGIDVLYDDRDLRAGEKFADADLIGSPVRLIVSKRAVEAGGIGMKQGGGEEQLVPVDDILTTVQAALA